MKDKYIFRVTYYQSGRGGLEVVPAKKTIAWFYINESILQDDEEDLFHTVSDEALTTHTEKKLGNNSWTTVCIGSDVSELRFQLPDKKPDIETMPTSELISLVDHMAEERRAFDAKLSWHGIPTHKENPTDDDAMYYDPQTGKTGPWKDIEKEWNPYYQKQK